MKKAIENGNGAGATRHILPIDADTVRALDRRLKQYGLMERGGFLESQIIACGRMCLPAGVARGIARMRCGLGAVVCTPDKRQGYIFAGGKPALIYADIGGKAGAVITALVGIWKQSREEVLTRCIMA